MHVRSLSQKIDIHAKDEPNIKIVPDNEDVLYYDEMSELFFTSSPSVILFAAYEVNRMLAIYGESCLNDFYDYAGADRCPIGAEIVWKIDDGVQWVDFETKYGTETMDDGSERTIGYISAKITTAYVERSEEYVG